MDQLPPDYYALPGAADALAARLGAIRQVLPRGSRILGLRCNDARISGALLDSGHAVQAICYARQPPSAPCHPALELRCADLLTLDPAALPTAAARGRPDPSTMLKVCAPAARLRSPATTPALTLAGSDPSAPRSNHSSLGEFDSRSAPTGTTGCATQRNCAGSPDSPVREAPFISLRIPIGQSDADPVKDAQPHGRNDEPRLAPPEPGRIAKRVRILAGERNESCNNRSNGNATDR